MEAARRSIRSLARWGSALVFSAGSFLFATRDAAAIVNVGAEAGIAKRTGAGLDVGPAYGFHAELNPIFGLYVGPYYFHYSLDQNGGDNVLRGVRFDAIGGRFRYILSIFGDDVKPYALFGFGYTRAAYPGQTTPDLTANPVAGNGIGVVTRSTGHFVEMPLGVGVAHQAFEIVQFDLGFTWRPAISSGGDAYSSVTHLSPPNGGWSLTLGLSLDI